MLFVYIYNGSKKYLQMQIMTTKTGERLLQFINSLKMEPKEFAQKTGIPTGTLHHIISDSETSRRNKPSEETLVKILLKYPDFSLNWLFTGKGSMLLSSDDPDKIVPDKDLMKKYIQAIEEKDKLWKKIHGDI